MGSIVEMAVMIVAAFVLAMGIKWLVVEPFRIPTPSMENTIDVGDRVLVNKFIYRFRAPEPGDIVVFSNPDGKGFDLIKRVIAVGGQTVDIKDGYVYVDGKKLDEPYVNPGNRDNYSMNAPFTVPGGFLWLMGDNRADSGDSRYFGPRPVTEVRGEAFATYWPASRWRGL